jgi:hypothetical protein
MAAVFWDCQYYGSSLLGLSVLWQQSSGTVNTMAAVFWDCQYYGSSLLGLSTMAAVFWDCQYYGSSVLGLTVLWQQSSGTVSTMAAVFWDFRFHKRRLHVLQFFASSVTLRIPSCLNRKCTGDTSVYCLTALVRHCRWCGGWFDGDCNCGSKYLTHVSSIVTIRYRNA